MDNFNKCHWELVQLILQKLFFNEINFDYSISKSSFFGNLILCKFVCKLWKSCVDCILHKYNKNNISYWILALDNLVLSEQWNLAYYIIDDMLILNPKLVNSRYISRKNIKYLMDIVMLARNKGNFEIGYKLLQYGVFGSNDKLNNMEKLHDKWLNNNKCKVRKNIKLLFVLGRYDLLIKSISYRSYYQYDLLTMKIPRYCKHHPYHQHQTLNLKIFRFCAYYSLISIIKIIFDNCDKIYNMNINLTDNECKYDAVYTVSDMIRQLAKYNPLEAKNFIHIFKNNKLIRNVNVICEYVNGIIQSKCKIDDKLMNNMINPRVINITIVYAITANHLELVKKLLENPIDNTYIIELMRKFNDSNLFKYAGCRDMLKRSYVYPKYFDMIKYLYDNNIITTKFIVKQSIIFNEPPDIIKYICNKENISLSQLIFKHINQIKCKYFTFGSYIIRHLRQRGKLLDEDIIFYNRKIIKKLKSNKIKIKSNKIRTKSNKIRTKSKII